MVEHHSCALRQTAQSQDNSVSQPFSHPVILLGAVTDFDFDWLSVPQTHNWKPCGVQCAQFTIHTHIDTHTHTNTNRCARIKLSVSVSNSGRQTAAISERASDHPHSHSASGSIPVPVPRPISQSRVGVAVSQSKLTLPPRLEDIFARRFSFSSHLDACWCGLAERAIVT